MTFNTFVTSLLYSSYFSLYEFDTGFYFLYNTQIKSFFFDKTIVNQNIRFSITFYITDILYFILFIIYMALLIYIL